MLVPVRHRDGQVQCRCLVEWKGRRQSLAVLGTLALQAVLVDGRAGLPRIPASAGKPLPAKIAATSRGQTAGMAPGRFRNRCHLGVRPSTTRPQCAEPLGAGCSLHRDDARRPDPLRAVASAATGLATECRRRKQCLHHLLHREVRVGKPGAAHRDGVTVSRCVDRTTRSRE